MSKQKLLPVRLRPDPGEHFSAYLLRLAMANGRSSVKELFSTLAIKGTRAQNHQSSETIVTVAQWLGLTPAQLNAYIVRDEILTSISAYDSARVYRNLELRVPRICIACLQAGTRTPAYFGQLPFTHCLTHDHELIHACPNCEAQFVWSEELFESCCPSCKSKLEVTTSAVTLPTYAAELVAHLSDQVGLNNFICDLLLALQCVLEPLNSNLSTRERPPTEIAYWPTLFAQAYSLLNHADAMESWAEACRQQRSVSTAIGTSAVYLPIIALKERLGLPWPVRDYDCHVGTQPIEKPIGLPATSLAAVDHHALSKVLGIEPSEILPMIETSVLESINGHRSVRGARFDLSALAQKIEQLDDGFTGELIGMVHAAKILAAHGANMGHLLAGILSKQIPFMPMQDRKTLLDGAHVGLEGLLTHMTKHFASLESTQCTLLETIAITGMNKKEITKACALGLIKPQGWRRELCFLGGDISRLLSSHISIKRWSRISGVPTRRLLADLPASRFDASIEGVLYKRTEELGSWLDSFAAPSR